MSEWIFVYETYDPTFDNFWWGPLGDYGSGSQKHSSKTHTHKAYDRSRAA